MIRLDKDEMKKREVKQKPTSVLPAVRKVIRGLPQEALDEISRYLSEEGVEGNKQHDTHACAMVLRREDAQGLLNGTPSAKITRAMGVVLKKEYRLDYKRGVIRGYLEHQPTN